MYFPSLVVVSRKPFGPVEQNPIEHYIISCTSGHFSGKHIYLVRALILSEYRYILFLHHFIGPSLYFSFSVFGCIRYVYSNEIGSKQNRWNIVEKWTERSLVPATYYVSRFLFFCSILCHFDDDLNCVLADFIYLSVLEKNGGYEYDGRR